MWASSRIFLVIVALASCANTQQEDYIVPPEIDASQKAIDAYASRIYQSDNYQYGEYSFSNIISGDLLLALNICYDHYTNEMLDASTKENMRTRMFGFHETDTSIFVRFYSRFFSQDFYFPEYKDSPKRRQDTPPWLAFRPYPIGDYLFQVDRETMTVVHFEELK